MYRCFGYGFGGYNFFMMIPVFIVVLLAVYFIYKALNNKNKNYVSDTSSSRALSILNERLAKGEINEEEYKAKKNQILN